MSKTIIANWKCNPVTFKEANDLFASILKKVKNIKEVETVFCPPYVYLSLLQGQNILIGAQNCFWEDSGAFTGEVSAKQLADMGCSYAIIGHSERRKFFQETNQIIEKKLKAVLNNHMTPVLCVGETQEQRDRGETQKIIESELIEGLAGISEAKFKAAGFCIAYEPIWAIGTGRPCDVEESQKMNLLVKKIISEIYSSAVLKYLKILYGGSVNAKNAQGYLKEAGYDGLLVGGASLKADEFTEIVKSAI